MEIEEGVIRRGRRLRRITVSENSIILHMILSLIHLIVKYSGNGAPVATKRITADLKPFFGTKSTCSSHPTPPPPTPRGLPFDAQRSYKKKNRCDFHWIRRLSTSQLMSSLSGDFSVETTPFEG